MKKVMLLVSLAALSISGNALALRADGRPLQIFVAGTPSSIGRIVPVQSAPLAVACTYLLRWSAGNALAPIGNAVPCFLHETSTTTSFGCGFDRLNNIAALVNAGTFSPPGVVSPFCAGYDQYQLLDTSVSIMAGEVPDSPVLLPMPGLPGTLGGPHPKPPMAFPILSGTVCFNGAGVMPFATSFVVSEII